MDYIEKARRVIALEAAEIAQLAGRVDGRFVLAVECIQGAIGVGGKVVVLGVGKSGHIGEKIAATLTSTGTRAVVLNALNALHGDIGVVADGDVILALSASGETGELLNIFQALRRMRVQIVGMTGRMDSALARESDIVLDAAVSREACPLGLAPTSSTTAMLVLGDALAMVLLEARGFSESDFARFHPGGRLGALLQRVDQIMRSGDRMATVSPEMPVRDVLRVMSGCRAGVAVAIQADGSLAGIMTHSDFSRHFQRDPAIGDSPVSQFLTRSPITIRRDKLAVDVLQIIQQYRIDDVLVLDEEEKPCGVVDSQDLALHRLL